jgi:hypothetical protein
VRGFRIELGEIEARLQARRVREAVVLAQELAAAAAGAYAVAQDATRTRRRCDGAEGGPARRCRTTWCRRTGCSSSACR